MNVLWLLPTLFLFDVILGGPLGLLPLPHGRHLLFVLAMLGLALLALRRWGQVASYAVVPLGLVCGFILCNALWSSIIPLYQDHSLRLALAEADAYALLLAVPLFVASVDEYGRGLQRMLHTLFAFVLILATLQFLVWMAGMVVPEWRDGLRHALLTLYGRESMYVGGMPDGFFRVFWISSLWLIPAVFYTQLLVRSPLSRAIVLVVLVGATLGTYSRGLWLGLMCGALVWITAYGIRSIPVSYRPQRMLAAFAVGSVVLVSGGFMFGGDVAERLQGLTSSTDVSMSERLAQVEPLLEAWREHPLFGGGYGTYATLVRDEANPYSYEVVPLALLMKLGLVGVAGFGGFLAVVLVSALCRALTHPRESAAMAASFVAFMVATMTNPLLINFVGMGVMAVLLIHWVFLFRPLRTGVIASIHGESGVRHRCGPRALAAARLDNV